MRYCWLFIWIISPLLATNNPFAMCIKDKQELNYQDYIELQQKIKEVDILSTVDQLYSSMPPRKWYFPWKSSIAKREDFLSRMSKAQHQIFIDPDQGKLPSKHMIKIGDGGDCCIVCYVSFNGSYVSFLQEIASQLEKVGFNGYFFYRIGGFPTPTGKELKYAATPYCFKIFSLIEAHLMGFDKVLWIDAPFLPLKNPAPIFAWLDKEGCFFKMHEPFSKFIFPQTVTYIRQETGVNVLKTRYVSAQIIGFNFQWKKTQQFIEEYYRLLHLGLPFCSCFPEEYVFSAIVGQQPHLWKNQPFAYLSFPEVKLKNKSIEHIRKKGYFFLQKAH